MGTNMKLTLKEAEERTGVDRSTIFRAIRGRAGDAKRGRKEPRLSAEKGEDNKWRVDAAELFRVFPPRSGDADVGTAGTSLSNAPEPTVGTVGNAMHSPDAQTAEAVQAELSRLREELAAARKEATDLREAKALLEGERRGLERAEELHRDTVEDLRSRLDRADDRNQRLLADLREVERPRPGWWGRLLGR